MPTKIEKDEITGQDTTGHEWDGIKELNTPLPRWWLWTFYATVLWAIGYWVVYPAWPLIDSFTGGVLGYSSRAQLEQTLADVEASQAPLVKRIDAASLEDIRTTPELLEFAQAGGRSAFGLHCSQCHGGGAAGAKGYPNLNDDDWLWGGGLEAIHTTILVGIRSGHEETRDIQMPAFVKDEMLTAAEVADVAEHVLSLSGRAEDAAAAKRGAQIFADQCVGCHGEEGEGLTELGGPRLSDAIWLYGGDRDTIVETISFARRGVMPAWEAKLDGATIKALAVYVHSLGGGQ
jgi:cytochrome c oxidase cbb3-type subunit 3